MVLDPFALTPRASLNRVSIPGDSPGDRRRSALEALSAEGLVRLIGPARTRNSSSQEDGTSVLEAFDARLRTADPISSTAREVAEVVAKRVSYLVATLSLAPVQARALRPEWSDDYWQQWMGARTIWLGGGIVSGELGRFLDQRLPHLLKQVGVRNTRVMVAENPRWLPLIGAARSLRHISKRTVVLDFGHTAIKRGIASYHGDKLSGLKLLPSLELSSAEWATSTSDPQKFGVQLAQRVAATVDEAAESGDDLPSSEVLCSLACYLHDGQPHPDAIGAYASLRELAEDLPGWLSEQVERLTGRAVEVRLIHDGTAAGRALAPANHGAVIMLGTALGVGFIPDSATIPVSADFAVESGLP